MPANFIHLRVHSAYSLSEGAIKVKALVKLAADHGMPAVALTDTANLFGALEFASTAADAGVQPIIGCQMPIARMGPAPSGGGNRSVAHPTRDWIVLLAQNETGYRRLMRLVSQAYLATDDARDPALDLDLLEAGTEGLICLAGGPAGPIGRLIAEGQASHAAEALDRLARCFPERLYVELQRHGSPSDWQAVDEALIDLAYAHDLPLVATNDCFFADESMHEAHDALLCIADGTYVLEEDRRRVTPDHRFRSGEEMAALFCDIPEAIENTVEIARRCSFLLRPIKPILPAFPTADGRSEAEELRAQAEAGLDLRLAGLRREREIGEEEERVYRERLDFELGVIEGMKFPGYFLIVSDFIKWAKDHDIPVGPGRGSGAGSLVAYALLITDLDPLRFGLLFERFLNPERVSMPDFDIDFCQDRRDDVIRYVQDRYGRDRVAQIITFGKLQARAVLRNVGRVLQLPYGLVDRICRLVPNDPAKPTTLEEAIAGEPMLQHLRDTEEPIERLLDIALKLEGLYGHASTHAAGVVIGDRPLDELIPLYRDPRSEMPVTQFNMKWVEQAGLVKFDFLGLRTLTILKDAEALTRAQEVDFDLDRIPLDDAKSYEMISRGEASAVFQLESGGMRDALRRIRPERLEDVIALVALYRPGPMANIPRYARVKAGEEKPGYPHKKLEAILAETFGIIVYQEQVMQIAQILAGYSLGQADLLRRAMGKKDKVAMAAQREAFIEGAVAEGVEAAQAGDIFDLVAKFAEYGFNKSHAACYALVAYQTAYMKANHPVPFLAACMTHDMGNTTKLETLRQELTRLGFQLLPPDVNRSDTVFSVEADAQGKPAVRYALGAIKGIGAAAMRGLVAEREERGPFKSLIDLATRIDVKGMTRKQIEVLAQAGALDALAPAGADGLPSRHVAFAAADTLMQHAHSLAEERETGQVNLFGGADENAADLPGIRLPEVEDWDAAERLRREYEAIGFYLSGHPLDSHETALTRLGAVRLANLHAWLKRNGPGRAKVAAVVLGRSEKKSQSGNRFAFVRLSDPSGVVEATCFSESLSRNREKLESGALIVTSLDVQEVEDGLRLTLYDVDPLEEAAARAAKGLRVFLRNPEPVASIHSILEQQGQGRGRIEIVVGLDHAREVTLALPGHWQVTKEARAAMKAVRGIVDVQDL